MKRLFYLNIKTKMTKLLALLAGLSLFLIPMPTVHARGGGGGGAGGGGYGGGGHPSPMEQHGLETGIQEQRRQRVHTTEQQHSQYRTCVHSAERVRTRAREMTQAAKGQAFNREQAQQFREQLRNEIQMMEQNHRQFVGGLSQEQRTHIRERLREMDRTRERVNAHLQTMDQELRQGEFNGKRVAGQAGEIEKAMKAWHQQYQNVGSDLGV
jgi:hypothetical protein